MEKITSAINNIRLKERISTLKSGAETMFHNSKRKLRGTMELMKSDRREKNRILILLLSSLFLIDYVMFSYHIDKNIFDIFPSFPVIESKDTVNIYIPSEGCREIISETREIDADIDREILVKKLTALVAEGSYFENTSSNVPVKLLVKNVWITPDEKGGGDVCLIDISPVTLEREIVIIPGSEQMFRDSVEKTIKDNIPGITRVLILEKGVPFKKLWEI